MKLNSYRALFEKLDTRPQLDEKILAMAKDAKEGNMDFEETAAFQGVEIAPQKRKSLKGRISRGFMKVGVCAVVCALMLLIVWGPMQKGGVGGNDSYTSAVYEESMVQTDMTASWESMETTGLVSNGAEETATQASTEEAGEITMPQEMQEIPEFTGELDFTYVFDTDAQGELGDTSNKAYTQEGYYHLEQELDGEMLCFRTQTSFQSVPVCSKSDCAHHGEDCDAYFSCEEYPMSRIWYNQGNLYVLKLEEEYFCVYKVSSDGAVREKSCTLMRQCVEQHVYADGTTSTSYYFPTVQIHRGYVYFTNAYPGCEGCSLYRVKLDSQEEPEVLFTLSGSSPSIYNLRPYGKYVLFQMGDVDESEEDCSVGVYVYDTEEGTISRMSEEARWQYCIYKQDLYYYDEQFNVIKKDLETGEVSVFYENPDEQEEDVMYEVNVFSHGDELVLSIENMNTRYGTQVVFDETGTVISILQKKDGLLHPYTLE